ncbi:MAG: ABC transporter permease [Nitrospirae bacterium]|nr:ABC transporter permease [Nitrospirota bacterium]
MAQKNKVAGLPLLFVIFLFALSVVSPLLPLSDPEKIDLDSLSKPPGLEHPFGTDSKGRDIFARVVHGGRISISVAIAAAFISAVIGFTVGLTSGYFGGAIDTVAMSLTDFVLSFPSLLLAIAITVVLPPGLYTVMVALSAVGWTSYARLIRGRVIILREMAFVDAARAVGCGNMRILFLHIAPLCIPLALVLTGIKLAGFLLTEAALSFLGLGAQPPTATWGSMISANRAYIINAPWMVIFPGIALSLTAFCFNLIGEALKKRHGIEHSAL